MESVTPLFTAYPRDDRPSRSGKLWETSDYEAMVAAIRDGAADEAAIAERIGRSESTVGDRLRRLLPLPQRGCLPDRVLPALQDALADPDYDWAHEMLLSPPPTPIVRQEVIRSGLAGLNDDQVVTIAYALMASAGAEEAELLDDLAERLRDQRLIDRVVTRRAMRAVRASPHSIDEDAAWAHASYWVNGRGSYRNWLRRQHEPDW